MTNDTSTGSASVDVVVVGGGFAGLLLAAELTRRDVEVVVFDAAEHPGGVGRTIREDGFLLDPAAASLLMPNPALTPILQAAGADLEPATPAASHRFVYDRGTLFELEESPAILASRLVSWPGKARAAIEPWVGQQVSPPGDETLAHFARRRFGDEMGTLLATVMAHGVLAGDPDRLSARACFASMVELEDTAGSVVRGGLARMRSRPKGTPRPTPHVPPQGMAQLAEDLAGYLGGSFHRGVAVDKIAKADDDRWVVHADAEMSARHVVVATGPVEAQALVPGDLADLLEGSTAAPVAIVGLGGAAKDLPLPSGFGVLTGPSSGLSVLGVLFDSEMAAGRAPADRKLAKAIYGGAADPEVLSLDDDELVALACSELSEIIGEPVAPSWSRVVRHHPGIPQYNQGHLRWLDDLDQCLAGHPGLHLAGWAYRGVGLSKLAVDAVDLADLITSGR